jgi:hypothetical protein
MNQDKYDQDRKKLEIEDRESAIYATGYWNGIAYKNQQQTKPLTDEEIKTIIVQHIQTWNSLDSIIEFARAIEERHGIK